MTLNPAAHSTQVSFPPGCKVYAVGDPDVQGVVAGAGAEVSEVKFSDGKHRNIPNVHLRIATTPVASG